MVRIWLIKALITISADDTLEYMFYVFFLLLFFFFCFFFFVVVFFFFSEKIRLDISWESGDSHEMPSLIFSEK